MTYNFTPWHCLLGGLSLGVVSAAKPLLSSRILGISGCIKGIVRQDFSLWRWLFSGGMVLGGVAIAAFMPGAIEPLPATFTLGRAIAGGLLVGLGAAIGNGCTSGHGISGNARLSIRSAAYTLTFMAAGAAAVQLTGTLDALQVPSVGPVYQPLDSADLARGAALLGGAISWALGLGWLASVRKSPTASLVYEAGAGMLFALGLGFTGMLKPSKVASFLAFLQPAWNPSLMFVMGGALLVATPAMHFIKQRKTALDGTVMSMPTSSVIDWPLILGGVLFGTGWGVCGMCPGPLLVSVVQPSFSPQIMACFAAMLAGLYVGDAVKPGAAMACKADQPKNA